MLVVLLNDRPRRFGEVHRAVEGISKKVLTDTLRALERDGMVERSTDGEGVVRYGLTDLGRTLHEPLAGAAGVGRVARRGSARGTGPLRRGGGRRDPAIRPGHPRSGQSVGAPPGRIGPRMLRFRERPLGALADRGSAPTADPARS